MSAELILRAAPLLWAAGVSAAAILYARRRYMEAAGTGICRPRVPKPGLEHEYRGFLRSALIAAAAGTLALIIVERALLGVVDAATLGAAVAALGTLASTYTSAAGYRERGLRGLERANTYNGIPDPRPGAYMCGGASCPGPLRSISSTTPSGAR